MAPNNSILQEAYNLVNGPRKELHGDFKDNFERTAAIFNAWTGNHLSADDIAKVMQCLKMAREKNNPSARDNFVDQTGYIELRYLLGKPKNITNSEPRKGSFESAVKKVENILEGLPVKQDIFA